MSIASMMKLVDIADLKSAAERRAGSIPARGTKTISCVSDLYYTPIFGVFDLEPHGERSQSGSLVSREFLSGINDLRVSKCLTNVPVLGSSRLKIFRFRKGRAGSIPASGTTE